MAFNAVQLVTANDDALGMVAEEVFPNRKHSSSILAFLYY